MTDVSKYLFQFRKMLMTIKMVIKGKRRLKVKPRPRLKKSKMFKFLVVMDCITRDSSAT